MPKIREKIEKEESLTNYCNWIKKQKTDSLPIVNLVSEIELGQQFTENLKKYFPKETVGFVSSQTTDRLRMVEEFRKQSHNHVVSTTILEEEDLPFVDTLCFRK